MLTCDIRATCERVLGLGEFPLVRRRLYSRLQRVCEQRGDEPLLIVSECLLQAKNPNVRDPGKWFCAAVVRRLTDAGYWAQEASPNQTQQQARELAHEARSIVAATAAAIVVPPEAAPPQGDRGPALTGSMREEFERRRAGKGGP